jgi:hypothetical protein
MFNLTLSNFMENLNSMIVTFGIERGVFLKEENSKMYSTFTYFMAKFYWFGYFFRSLVELPIVMIMPLIQAVMIYWMVDLNTTETRIFFIFYLISLLISCVGNSVGILIAGAFKGFEIKLNQRYKSC